MSISEQSLVEGTIHISSYDSHVNCPNWSSMSRKEKLSWLEDEPPVQSSTCHNIACTGLFTWIVDALNAGAPNPPEANRLALGKAGGSGVSSTDTALAQYVDDVPITSYADEGTQVRFTVFVGAGEANVDTGNGETISEVGVYSDDRFMNHALLDTKYEKNNSKTMTMEVVFEFGPAGF